MGDTSITLLSSITSFSPLPYQKIKVNTETSSINTVTTIDLTHHPTMTSSWKDEQHEITKESNDNMKQLINENNTTMTKTLNENINEKIKEFQTKLMKTVKEMIAKQMSIINLNMINTIQGTLTNQTHQVMTQEVIQ